MDNEISEETQAASLLAQFRRARERLHHDGAWQGFQTAIDRYVDDQLTVVALSNLSGAEPGKITQHVAEMYLAAK